MSPRLTPRQQRFIDAYLLTRNASEAARQAGYSARRAATTGSELLKRPAIIATFEAHGVAPPRGVHPSTQLRQPRRVRAGAGLSPREERFALAYLQCGNAAEAARRIGIAAEQASQSGCRLAHRPRVAAFIAAERAASAERTRIDADRVRRELARIAFADIGAIAEWSEEGFALKPSAAIAADDRAAIAELTAKHGKHGLKASIKLHSKQRALESLAKLLGLYARGGAAAAPWLVDGQDPRKVLVERLRRIAKGEEEGTRVEPASAQHGADRPS